MAAHWVMEMSVATGECFPVCLSPHHHHRNRFSSHLDVNAFSGLKADILKLSQQQPRQGGGFTPLATKVSHTPAVCVNSLCVSPPARLPCPYVGIRMISQIPSVNKVTSDSSCAVLHANSTQPFAFSWDKERLKEPHRGYLNATRRNDSKKKDPRRRLIFFAWHSWLRKRPPHSEMYTVAFCVCILKGTLQAAATSAESVLQTCK